MRDDDEDETGTHEPEPNRAHELVFLPAVRGHEPRLDLWIYEQLDEIPSRSLAQSLILRGKVALERQSRLLRVKPSLRLCPEDIVRVDLTTQHVPLSLSPEPMELRIVYEDEHILVINKPAGLVVHPGAGVASGTLVNGLLAYLGTGIPSLGGRMRAGLVHRLDRDTSGVMVAAKTERALVGLSEAFRKHEHLRQYHAVVFGTPVPPARTLETGHARHANARTRFATAPLGTGKRACTHMRVIESLGPSSAFSLVECTLETGRTHQIRVHMEACGHPIVGDPVYQQPPSRAALDIVSTRYPHAAAWVRKNVSRQLLHAVTLGIRHPVTQENILFSSSYDSDMETCLTHLRSLSSLES